MVTLVHLASVVSVLTLSLFKDISDQEFRRNIEALRNKVWFQMYWNEEEFRKIIETDPQMRNVIGFVNPSKLNQKRYAAWQRKKIVTLLENKMKNQQEDAA